MIPCWQAGPAYTFEKIGPTHRDFLSCILAERFRHKFNKCISLEQSLTYAFEVEDPNNHEIDVDLLVDTRITELLVFRVGMEYTYENQPACGRVKGDLGIFSSVAIRF